MKMLTLRGLLALFLLILSGCGGLLEMWAGPGSEAFKPKTIAVLPPMVGPYEGARDPSQAVLVNVLGHSGRFEMIAGLDNVNSAFANKEASDLLAAYYSKLETTGQSDKDMAAKLGQLVHADALLVPKINNWEYGHAEGDSFGKVGFGLRLIDTNTGGIVWKGRHEKVKTYMLFKPSLKDIAQDLSEYMLKYFPQ
jgi:hypothetical protein